MPAHHSDITDRFAQLCTSTSHASHGRLPTELLLRIFADACALDMRLCKTLLSVNNLARQVSLQILAHSPLLSSTSAVQHFLDGRHSSRRLDRIRVDDLELDRIEARQTFIDETKWDKQPEEVTKELEVWTDLLKFLLSTTQEHVERGTEPESGSCETSSASLPRSSHLQGLALSSAAIARLVGAPRITWPGDARPSPVYHPAPIDNPSINMRFWQDKDAQSKIIVDRLALSGSDYSLPLLWRRIEVRQHLTLYTCSHAMRYSYWSMLEHLPTPDGKFDGTGRNIGLRFVQGRMDWSRRSEPRWPLYWVVQFARMQLLRRRNGMYPPFDRIRLELIGEDQRSFEDFKTVLDALPKKFLDCDNFCLVRRAGGSSQNSVERSDWESGAALQSLVEAASAHDDRETEETTSAALPVSSVASSAAHDVQNGRAAWCGCDVEGGPIQTYGEEVEQDDWNDSDLFDEDDPEDASELEAWQEAMKQVNAAYSGARDSRSQYESWQGKK